MLVCYMYLMLPFLGGPDSRDSNSSFGQSIPGIQPPVQTPSSSAGALQQEANFLLASAQVKAPGPKDCLAREGCVQGLFACLLFLLRKQKTLDQ